MDKELITLIDKYRATGGKVRIHLTRETVTFLASGETVTFTHAWMYLQEFFGE